MSGDRRVKKGQDAGSAHAREPTGTGVSSYPKRPSRGGAGHGMVRNDPKAETDHKVSNVHLCVCVV